MDTETPKQGVIFAIPCLEFNVDVEFLESWTQTLWALAEHGIMAGVKIAGGDCFVAKARNMLATTILAEYPNATDIFFLDKDIGWPAEKVVAFLKRPEDIVAGVYCRKTDRVEYPAGLEMREDGTLIEQDGLYRAISAPTGFMRVKRGVFEAMAPTVRIYKEVDREGKENDRLAFFESGLRLDPVDETRAEWWGEDYTFCQKWRALGGTVWVDPDIVFTHRGQKAWVGHFKSAVDSWLASQAKVAA